MESLFHHLVFTRTMTEDEKDWILFTTCGGEATSGEK